MDVNSRYVLMTAAKDEEAFIERTIESVLGQTVKPTRWVVVSDGSTDGTDAIVGRHCVKNSFMELIQVPAGGERNFAGKASALRLAYGRLRGCKFDFVGNLDADVSLLPDYYRDMQREMDADPRLGIVGGIVFDLVNGKYARQRLSSNSVAGPVQFFRRACYEAIGEYLPLPHGGVDAAAEIMARMKGWETRTCPQVEVRQHRAVGFAKGHVLNTRFWQGQMFHSLGYSALFETLRCFSRIGLRPLFAGSAAELIGFICAGAVRQPIGLPAEAVAFLRQEQLKRILGLLRREKGESRPKWA